MVNVRERIRLMKNKARTQRIRMAMKEKEKLERKIVIAQEERKVLKDLSIKKKILANENKQIRNLRTEDARAVLKKAETYAKVFKPVPSKVRTTFGAKNILRNEEGRSINPIYLPIKSNSDEKKKKNPFM